MNVRLLMVLFLMIACLLAPTAAGAQDPGPAPGETPNTEFTFSSSHEASTLAVPANCFGAAFAYKAGSTAVAGQANLNCTGTVHMKIDLELWECDWGWTAYCGGQSYYAQMAVRYGSSGSIWAPDGYSAYVSVGTDDCYMVRAFMTVITASGATNTGYANSDIKCFE